MSVCIAAAAAACAVAATAAAAAIVTTEQINKQASERVENNVKQPVHMLCISLSFGFVVIAACVVVNWRARDFSLTPFHPFDIRFSFQFL